MKDHDPLTPRPEWEKEALDAARKNHIWVNAFACINPSEKFCADLGREILRWLDSKDQTILSEYRLVGSERELILRVNKS